MKFQGSELDINGTNICIIGNNPYCSEYQYDLFVETIEDVTKLISITDEKYENIVIDLDRTNLKWLTHPNPLTNVIKDSQKVFQTLKQAKKLCRKQQVIIAINNAEALFRTAPLYLTKLLKDLVKEDSIHIIMSYNYSLYDPYLSPSVINLFENRILFKTESDTLSQKILGDDTATKLENWCDRCTYNVCTNNILTTCS